MAQDIGQLFGGTEAKTTATANNRPSAAEIVSGAASGFGVLTNLMRTRAEAQGLEARAAESDQNARVEGVNAEATKNVIRRRLNETLANNAAALSASGIDPTSGSARVVQEQSVSAGNKAFFETDLNARIRVAALKRQAEQLRQAAKEERRAGRRQATLGLISTGLRFMGGGAA